MTLRFSCVGTGKGGVVGSLGCSCCSPSSCPEAASVSVEGGCPRAQQGSQPRSPHVPSFLPWFPLPPWSLHWILAHFSGGRTAWRGSVQGNQSPRADGCPWTVRMARPQGPWETAGPGRGRPWSLLPFSLLSAAITALAPPHLCVQMRVQNTTQVMAGQVQ